MNKLKIDLSNLEDLLYDKVKKEDIPKIKTLFLKKLAFEYHKFYKGKIQTIPKAGIWGFNWFNVWYTPGVSEISTSIRDNQNLSYELSNRSNTVGIVSDSTRVLGDGNVTPPGGLGVMEGKAFLMKYLGGIDAIPLCINSENDSGENDPDKIIDFVKMVQPSFGAINLEDISQPNCFKVLDSLKEECNIPVWHDDAQGTASVTLAGVLNSLKLTNRSIDDIKIVLIGAGASNSTIARFLIKAGANPGRIIIFDSKGSLHRNRNDIKEDKRFYRKWELCETTNSAAINEPEKAVENADLLIALSKPGPKTVPPEWISKMSPKSIVFACANPVPEIYPEMAKKAGAYIVATGRGDFPNQVNNSLGFPGILKGALMVNAGKITDNMAINAAYSLADFAEKKGMNPQNIIPNMEDFKVFPEEAADVAMQAISDKVARKKISRKEAFNQAYSDIKKARSITEILMREKIIKQPNQKILQNCLEWTLKQI